MFHWPVPLFLNQNYFFLDEPTVDRWAVSNMKTVSTNTVLPCRAVMLKGWGPDKIWPDYLALIFLPFYSWDWLYGP